MIDYIINPLLPHRHLCPDWCFADIAPGDIEMETCRCFRQPDQIVREMKEGRPAGEDEP